MPRHTISDHSAMKMVRKSTDPRDYQHIAQPAGVMPKEFPSGLLVPEHWHERAQLIYSVRGVIEVRTAHAMWRIAPQRAVWMPAMEPHCMVTRGHVSLRTLYIRSDACPEGFPTTPTLVNVSPLLAELILRAAELPMDYQEAGRAGRLMAVLLDEIEWSQEKPLRLPDDGDRRLRRICETLMEAPADTRTLAQWAEQVGASTRTLSRLFDSELGATFIQWRHQARLLAAYPRLAAGESVANIALSLGYETPSAFAAMFRRLTGATPSQYFKLSDSA